MTGRFDGLTDTQWEMLGVKSDREFIVDSFPVIFCQNHKSYRCQLFPVEAFHAYTASKSHTSLVSKYT